MYTKVLEENNQFRWKTNHKNSFLLGFSIRILRFPINIFVNGKIEIPLKSYCVMNVPVYSR